MSLDSEERINWAWYKVRRLDDLGKGIGEDYFLGLFTKPELPHKCILGILFLVKGKLRDTSEVMLELIP